MLLSCLFLSHQSAYLFLVRLKKKNNTQNNNKIPPKKKKISTHDSFIQELVRYTRLKFSFLPLQFFFHAVTNWQLYFYFNEQVTM